MRKLPSSLGRVARTLGLIMSACFAIGCEEPETVQEAKGSTTTRYMAPDPTLCATSSAQTQADLGIAKWCAYRGKGGVYLTGYTSNGHAVKGLSTEFARAADGSVNAIRLSVNDGSKFSVFHTLGSSQIMTTNGLQMKSRQLVNAATRDLGLLHSALRQRVRVGTLTAKNRCASNILGSILSPFVGAGVARGAALGVLSQMGRFANASGSTCAPFIGSGRSGVNGLPFGGSIAQIDPQTACAGDPDPRGCMAEFGMFSNVGTNGGFSFDPNTGIPGQRGAVTFPGADPTISGRVFQPLPGPSSVFNPTTDGVTGANDDGCGGCTAYGYAPPNTPLPTPRPPGTDGADDDGCGGCTAYGYAPPNTPLPTPRPAGTDGSDDGCGGCTAFSQTDPGENVPVPQTPEPGRDPASLDPDLHPTFSEIARNEETGEPTFSNDFGGFDGDTV